MSFPWGWLLVHIGVGMIFKEKYEEWSAQKEGASVILLVHGKEQDGSSSEQESEGEEAADVDSDIEDA